MTYPTTHGLRYVADTNLWRRLRWSSSSLLSVRPTRLHVTMDDRAFPVAGERYYFDPVRVSG